MVAMLEAVPAALDGDGSIQSGVLLLLQLLIALFKRILANRLECRRCARYEAKNLQFKAQLKEKRLEKSLNLGQELETRTRDKNSRQEPCKQSAKKGGNQRKPGKERRKNRHHSLLILLLAASRCCNTQQVETVSRNPSLPPLHQECWINQSRSIDSAAGLSGNAGDQSFNRLPSSNRSLKRCSIHRLFIWTGRIWRGRDAINQSIGAIYTSDWALAFKMAINLHTCGLIGRLPSAPNRLFLSHDVSFWWWPWTAQDALAPV